MLSRQNLPTIDRSLYAPAEGLQRGAYILSEAQGSKPDVILVASGSEVPLIMEAQQILQAHGIGARLVSMPSWELFDRQPQDYREAVFPPAVTARLAVEAGSPQGWEKYAGSDGELIALDHFGASAPGEVLMEKFGFTAEHVAEVAKATIEKCKEEAKHG